MRIAAAIAVAGAVGALARYGLDVFVSRRNDGAFPWGTFVVNISGAFALGIAFTLFSDRFSVAPWLRAAVTVGFLGAYTTFSTLSLQTYRLLDAGNVALALANALGSVAAGLAALYAGITLARLL
jgi:fluoride exporter